MPYAGTQEKLTTAVKAALEEADGLLHTVVLEPPDIARVRAVKENVGALLVRLSMMNREVVAYFGGNSSINNNANDKYGSGFPSTVLFFTLFLYLIYYSLHPPPPPPIFLFIAALQLWSFVSNHPQKYFSKEKISYPYFISLPSQKRK